MSPSMPENSANETSAALVIQCFYSCHACKLEEIAVNVPVREEGKDLKQWIEEIMMWHFARDHARRSPGCFPRELNDVMIPISGADMVGGPAKQ